MISYKVTSSGVKLIDSYTVPRWRMGRELLNIRAYTPTCPLWGRSDKSIIREWCVHNALYALGIARERTKDVDLDYNPKWYMSALYWFLGAVVGPFIK